MVYTTNTKCLNNLLEDLQSKDSQKNLFINSYALDKAKIIVNTIEVATALTLIGFYQETIYGQPQFCLYHNGIKYSGFTKDEIAKFILDIHKKYSSQSNDILNKLNIAINRHIKKETHVVGILPPFQLKEYRDPKGITRVFFRNIIRKVTIREIITESYIQFAKSKAYIDASKIIDFDYDITKADANESDIRKVDEHITNDNKHLLSIKSLRGFHMHRRKDKRQKTIFVVSDENSLIKNGKSGQSGKDGIFRESLKQVLNVGFESGENMNIGFPFQSITQQQDVFIFGDAPKNFPIPKLHELKSGIDVEIKQRSKAGCTIPYEYAPHIMIITNYRLGGNNSSDKNRIFRLTINNHYDSEYTPYDDFNRTLFDDWNKSQWNNFYAYMIHCAQVFLTYGLIEYENPEIVKVMFSNSTSKEFINFTNNVLELDKWYILSNLTKELLPDRYAKYSSNASKTVLKWLNEFSNSQGLILETKTGGGNKTHVIIKQPDLLSHS